MAVSSGLIIACTLHLPDACTLHLPYQVTVSSGLIITAGKGSSASDDAIAPGSLLFKLPSPGSADQTPVEVRAVGLSIACTLYLPDACTLHLPYQVRVVGLADEAGKMLVREVQGAGVGEVQRTGVREEGGGEGCGEQTVLSSSLRPRLETAYRILTCSGGFQRGTLEAVGSDGSLCVAFAAGGRRWVSAAEVEP